MKKFIDVIIPNNQISADVEIDLNTIVTSLYETSAVNGKQKILSTDKISDMLALSGINFAKEYDKLMKGEQVDEKPSATLNFKDLNNVSLSLRGGGGRPNPGGGGPTKPSITQPETTDKDKLTVEQHMMSINQDMNIRMGLAIAYSIILPILILANIFFFGFNASIIVDIIFSALTITLSWIGYYAAKEYNTSFVDALIETTGLNIISNPITSSITSFLLTVKKNLPRSFLSTKDFWDNLVQTIKTISKTKQFKFSVFSFVVQSTIDTLEKILLGSGNIYVL